MQDRHPGDNSSGAGILDGESGHASAPLPFFAIYAVVAVGFWFAFKGGLYTLVAPLAMTFVAVPLFDVLLGVDTRNPPPSGPGGWATLMFRFATWLALPVQGLILCWALRRATASAAPPLEMAGLVLAVGINGGVLGITVAHELIHRSSRADRLVGGALLVAVCYLHWAIEHVAGHHRRVATPEDPATARYGESLPAFMIRSAGFGFASAWRIEAARNTRRGVHSPFRNRVLLCVMASGALLVALTVAFGPRAIWFFLGQSVVAVAFLETINYIEHYGLERKAVAPGVYERVGPLHSWNTAHRLTNALLFNLQRHSDHHIWPARPYYMLRHRAESPQLPTGYAGMALLAMCPPLWRRVMHPRLAALRAQRLAHPAGEAPAAPPLS
jgi:alkane 1-monooxygenase